VLEIPALQLEIVDEIAREIQRAHWFDATYEIEHAGMLAALLDFAPEPWQELDTFRPWVHALRDAMLGGGITVSAIELFVSHFAEAFQGAVGVEVLARLKPWNDAKSAAGAAINSAPALIENPSVRRFARVPDSGLIEPLSQFTITNHGETIAPASFLLTGTPLGREAAPLIANLTTGDVLIYADDLPEGKRLWIHAAGSSVVARLENEDVTAKLRSAAGLAPGTPLTAAQLVAPAKPLSLVRGANALWFYPIGLFNVRGLDRFLFSMPDLSVAEGRFDGTRFDHALFYQQPEMVLHVAWTEETPASFEVQLPAAVLRTKHAVEEAMERRALLEASLAEGVGLLHAAGVEAVVTMKPFAETQPQLDRLRLVMPVILREQGTTGADRLTEHGGAFEVTAFDDSIFR
jgi:hypothetical protein